MARGHFPRAIGRILFPRRRRPRRRRRRRRRGDSTFYSRSTRSAVSKFQARPGRAPRKNLGRLIKRGKVAYIRFRATLRDETRRRCASPFV